ncbi:replication factor-a protein [Calocera cornea HHB12733]|uniref:Replication protein A subunit n=1 Tax=Calocera cornea HHB12733 TaxID=1353952 RepID=A0A165JAJ8_9BASI|nr:replication factor-a protein [Calocera cornea HHB12733]
MEQLTRNAISQIITAKSFDNFKPVVQLLHIQRVAATRAGAPDQVRLKLSDGRRWTHALLAPRQLSSAMDGLLNKFCLLRLNDFSRNPVQDKQWADLQTWTLGVTETRWDRVVIVKALDVVKQEKEGLGDPQPIDIHGPTFVQETGVATPVLSGQSKLNRISGKPTTTGFNSVSSMNGQPAITPLSEVSSYCNKWTVKARISQKSDIRTWSNERSSGHLFSFVMMDETMSIKATAFKDEVDKFFDQVQEGRVYHISRGRVVPAKKQFNKTDNDFEVILGKDTTIEECEDESNVPEIDQSYTPLANLQDLNKDQLCNILGIVTEIGQVFETVTRKTQRAVSKRDLTIVDRSGFSCRITLWGKIADDFDVPVNPVISFRGLRVGDFNGRSLSYENGTSRMEIQPDSEEAHAMRGWFEAVGATQTYTACQGTSAPQGTSAGLDRKELLSIADVINSNIGMEKAEYFTVKLRILWTPNRESTFSYPACRTAKCQKKLEEKEDTDQWQCAKCDTVWDEPEYRYTTRIGAADHKESAWFSVFDEVAAQLFEMKAIDLQNLKESDEHGFARQMRVPQSKQYYFKCKAQESIVNSQSRVKYTILKAFPIHYITEIKQLIRTMKESYDS